MTLDSWGKGEIAEKPKLHEWVDEGHVTLDHHQAARYCKGIRRKEVSAQAGYKKLRSGVHMTHLGRRLRKSSSDRIEGTYLPLRSHLHHSPQLSLDER